MARTLAGETTARSVKAILGARRACPAGRLNECLFRHQLNAGIQRLREGLFPQQRPVCGRRTHRCPSYNLQQEGKNDERRDAAEESHAVF